MPPLPGVDYSDHTGVYRILNTVNGKSYIGSAAQSFGLRFRIHRGDLRKGIHKNQHLQSAWNKYGEDAFRFIVLELCHTDLCIEREQHYLDKYQTANRTLGYNKSPTAGSPLGVKHSEQSRKNMSEGIKAAQTPELSKLHSEVSKALWDDPIRREALLKKRAESMKRPETRKKISEAGKGRKLSDEHKAILLAASKGRIVSQETKDKIANAVRNMSDETREKMRQASRRRWDHGPMPEEVRQKISNGNKGKKITEETRQRYRVAATKREAAKRQKKEQSNAESHSPDRTLFD